MSSSRRLRDAPTFWKMSDPSNDFLVVFDRTQSPPRHVQEFEHRAEDKKKWHLQSRASQGQNRMHPVCFVIEVFCDLGGFSFPLPQVSVSFLIPESDFSRCATMLKSLSLGLFPEEILNATVKVVGDV